MNTTPTRVQSRATAVGAWSAIITGTVHLLGSLVPIPFDGEAGARRAMRAAEPDLGLQTNFELLFDAMSQVMSIMFVAFGVITLAVVRNAAGLLATSRPLRWFNLGVGLACLAVVAYARLLPPIITMSIATAAFAVALPSGAKAIMRA
ncbi:hypothetical protein ACFWY5_30080 [Nonomuraea sp. NPDC059007]|uniref:LIC_13387 family protein n=1 Tax=Nonomuraea sp. NPDC059007 TaxID=3346692 RepID=UPI0036826D0F